jgi:hypothetical protein
MHRFVAVLTLGLISATDLAQAEPLTTSGIGLASCERLASDIKPEQGLNHAPNAFLYFWVQGYMSAANITTLESDSEYIDLSKYDEKVVLPAVQEFCSKNPTRKPISLIDDILNTAPKLKGEWKKGTIPWAAD